MTATNTPVTTVLGQIAGLEQHQPFFRVHLQDAKGDVAARRTNH